MESYPRRRWWSAHHSPGAQRLGLWCKAITTACRGYDTVSYNKRTHLIVPLPVLQKQSRCVPQRRTWAVSTKKKRKAGGGVMCDPNASVQSIIRVQHGAVWGTRQEKGTVFESRWRFFGKIKNWVAPSGDQNKFELSSCSETTWQGINIELKEVVGSNRERFQKVYMWRLTVDGKPCQKSSILGWGIEVAI